MMRVRYLAAVLLLAACGVIIIAAGGCSAARYKADADEEVYNIIDGKWQDKFGPKANYHINDVEKDANDIVTGDVRSIEGKINLAEAAAIATANNRDYQSRKELMYVTALDLTFERHQFARRWFGTFDSSYVNDADDESIGAGGEVGFSQKLASGAVVSTGIAVDWLRFLTGSPDTSLGSVLSASITQPLLRGSGKEVAQENLTQAERNALYQIRSFNRFRKTFIVSIVTDYYRVLQSRDAVTNEENNYKRVKETRDRLAAEAEVGRMPQFEVDQAQQNVLKAKDSYVGAQRRYEELLDEFKIRLALPTDANIVLDQQELAALSKIGITEPGYTLDDAIETSLVSRLDLETSRDRIDDAVRKIVVAEDALGAQLDLFAEMDVDSAGKTDFGNLQFHNGTYQVGIQADLPFDRKAERNAYRESLIALMQRQREYQDDEDQVKLNVRQAYRELIERSERYYIQKNSLELAQRRVESTKLLLETGRAQTRDVLDAQDALLEAENSVTAALVDHTIAKLNFFRDIGILKVRPDGMWDQKTFAGDMNGQRNYRQN